MDRLAFSPLSIITIRASACIDIHSLGLSENDFQGWIEAFEACTISSGSTSRIAQVLLFGSCGNGKSIPMRLTKQHYVSLLGALRLPTQFVLGALGNNGSLAHFVDYESEIPFKPCYLTILTHTPYGPNYDFSAAIRVDIVSGRVLAFYLDKDEISFNKVMKDIEPICQQNCTSPLDILTFFFRTYGRFNEEWRELLDRQVASMEIRTGMTSLDTSRMHYADDANMYEELTRDLHACNTELIFLSDMLYFELKLGVFCRDMFDVFEGLRKELDMDPFHNKRSQSDFQQNLEWSINMSEQRQRQTMSLKTRIQSQINLLYSLISQRDSRVNLMVAESSKQIAEDARLDSRTMKTIALVTLIFLPGTLIASIFSTDFIDLNAEQSDKLVAPYWWVFVLVMLVLTGIVLLVWSVWNWTYLHRSRGPIESKLS